MKQHISEEQFNKLPNKAQTSLIQWTIGKGYAAYNDPAGGGYGYQFEPEDDRKIWCDYPRLSLGQLIEFLAEKKKDIHIERFDGGKKHSYWNVSTCYEEEWKFGIEQKELCDVLWEAVKKELEIQKKDYIDNRQKLFKGKSVTSLYKEAKKFNRK